MNRENLILQVLAGQSPEYLIHPDATAFKLEGLEPDDVEAGLAALLERGHAAYFEDVQVRPVMETVEIDDEEVEQPKLDKDGNAIFEDVLDEQGGKVLLNHGWQISEAGKKEVGGV